MFAFGCLLTVGMVLIYTHMHKSPLWMLCVVMVLLQIGIFSRIISSSAMLSALPQPADRGSYMSVSSSLQQVAAASHPWSPDSSWWKRRAASWVHFDILGYVLVCTTAITLVMMSFIDRKLAGERAREAITNTIQPRSESVPVPE